MASTYTNHKGLKSALGAPPKTGHIEYKATSGLYLRVYASGLGIFVHRYKIDGQRRVFSLPTEEVSKSLLEGQLSTLLSQARAAHAQQRAQLKAGIDPAVERDLKAQEISAMPTVAQFVDIYIKRYAKPKKKSWAEDQRQLNIDIVPTIGNLPLDKVKRFHLIALLDQKQDAGALVARNRLISLLSKFFGYALERGHIENNPVMGIKRTKEKARERALTEDEMRMLWAATGENSYFTPSVRFALRLILVTGQRSSEVLQMHESQINDKLWTIPDTKNGQVHTVPLSSLALALIEEAKPYSREGLIVPSTKSIVMEPQVLSKAMSRIKWEMTSQDKPRPHDLRRTCITGISTLGFGRLVQDKVANHIDRSVGGVYDRYDYAKEKRQALEAWARKLSEVLHGQASDNVVTFQRNA